MSFRPAYGDVKATALGFAGRWLWMAFSMSPVKVARATVMNIAGRDGQLKPTFFIASSGCADFR
jgi:hypothetical protein